MIPIVSFYPFIVGISAYTSIYFILLLTNTDHTKLQTMTKEISPKPRSQIQR